MMRKIFQIIPVISVLAIVFITYANYVDDLDFWWHLKSGQIMYETHAIPQKDDFAYTTYISDEISHMGKDADSSGTLSEKLNRFWTSRFIKRNWLSQLIFYIVYLLGGFIGIGILKSSVFVTAFLVLYLTMLRRGAGSLSSFFVLCLIAYVAADFNYTRPQLFSFLFFACMFSILYDFKRGGKGIYFLPALMLIWANLHGGFILGVLIILAFNFAELTKHVLHNFFRTSNILPLPKEKLKTLGLFSFGSLLLSMINPGSYKTFLFPWYQGQSVFSSIEEYHSPMLYEYHAYWLMLFLLVIFILFLAIKKHLDVTELILCLILIWPSLRSNKYIIYFALGSGMVLAYAITDSFMSIKEWSPYKKLRSKTEALQLNRNGAVSLLLAAVSVIVLFKISSQRNVMGFGMREQRYPAGAVTFVRETKLMGNMFNIYNWGGYLVWHLYPDYRVFIYGRTLNETAFFHYNEILRASKGDDQESPLWKRLLDAYEVNFILTSAVTSAGSIIPLVDNLYNDHQWELVYLDGKSMIFVKAVKANYDILHKHHLSKERIYDEIIRECMQGIAEHPATWGYYETLGFVYMKKNRFREAIAMFDKYLSMNPGNQNVRYSRDLLKRYLEKL